MEINACLHTAILVSDLAAAEQFYGQVLGLTKVDRVLKFPGAWYQLGDYQIHLILNTNYQNLLNLPQKWGRDRHLAFAVQDLAAAKQTLIDHNCPVQISASGRSALFTHDPDGNVIELAQIS
ncbi:VOC family protein [Thalassoporum mexicanum]|uniref:VOC family protein n=1 Tax=Thalassoporum mexicanum TaxID=3457544 RepID=UPI0005A0C015